MQSDTSNIKKSIRILLFSFFSSVCVGSRPFYSPEMCDRNRRISDCSFQFPVDHTNACQIYMTDACKTSDFPPWNLEPLSKPASESDSEFNATVLPYAVYVNEIHKADPVSAINITLTSLNEGISGFSVVMTEDIQQRNICRIFDFRNISADVSVPFTLYYDCFNCLVEDRWENISMIFKAYPLNIELSYHVYIPPKPESDKITACDWKPLVMIYRGSLQKNIIQMKFSNAPENLNITFFSVVLLDSSGAETSNITIPSNSKREMISSEFLSVQAGYYSISVDTISATGTCTVYKTAFFFVGDQIKDYSLIVFIILLILIVISASALLYFSCRWYIQSAASTSKPTLFFVYFYKQLHHKFLEAYSEYLENHYGVKVNLLYDRTGNPKKWLEDKYRESGIIVFVISEGLQTLDQNDSPENEHHWIEQLPEAKALIDDSYIGRKKMCKICFSYSGRHHVPNCLEHQGPFFTLPGDMDDFLCFIFDCSCKLNILSKLCCEKHHNVINPNLKLEKDEKIEENLKIIVETMSKEIEKDEKIEENLKTTKMETMSKGLEKIKENLKPTMETTSKDLPVQEVKNVDDKSVLYECKIQPDFSNLKNNLITSDNMLKNCENRNPEVPSQKPDFEDLENVDFMRYLVCKILNSGK